MKALTFEAARSLNSGKCVTLRRVWMRGNVMLRGWCRRMTAEHGRSLLAVLCAAVAVCIIGVLADEVKLTAMSAMVAVGALTPELLAMSYETGKEVAL